MRAAKGGSEHPNPPHFSKRKERKSSKNQFTHKTHFQNGRKGPTAKAAASSAPCGQCHSHRLFSRRGGVFQFQAEGFYSRPPHPSLWLCPAPGPVPAPLRWGHLQPEPREADLRCVQDLSPSAQAWCLLVFTGVYWYLLAARPPEPVSYPTGATHA